MSEKSEKTEEEQEQELVDKEVSARESPNSGSCLFTFDTHPYYPFLYDPYSSSKYGSQVRERKIDRCLKQLQEALRGDK